jgi:hypothetical protein
MMTAAPSNIEYARAILAGKPIPEGGVRWDSLHECPQTGSRLKELLAPAPRLTVDDLMPLFSDFEIRDGAHPEDKALAETYNALCPVGRAIDEVIGDLASRVVDAEIANPIYLHELRQAQRRTLELLLEMAEQTTTLPESDRPSL